MFPIIAEHGDYLHLMCDEGLHLMVLLFMPCVGYVNMGLEKIINMKQSVILKVCKVALKMVHYFN